MVLQRGLRRPLPIAISTLRHKMSPEQLALFEQLQLEAPTKEPFNIAP